MSALTGCGKESSNGGRALLERLRTGRLSMGLTGRQGVRIRPRLQLRRSTSPGEPRRVGATARVTQGLTRSL